MQIGCRSVDWFNVRLFGDFPMNILGYPMNLNSGVCKNTVAVFDAAVYETNIQTRKRFKQTLVLIGQHKTRAHFQGKAPFQEADR